ncbi:glycoside hydrolase family 75 protein [Streptomyces sp. NPDC001027]|uniref:glycoside hydrolase family 75 protein n=1 Tax=Streptomyces sp. NPDC001027 TaxID=3154771 RepID=UPI00331693A4
MRVQSLSLAVAGIALLAPTTSPTVVRPTAGAPGAPASHQEGSVRAADLLSRVRDCTPVSRGRYRTDEGAPATIPVCGTEEAVFWTADMDIDCDGRPGPRCNSGTDPLFSAATAFQQSDGRHLSAESLPYIVVPGPSDVWDHRDHGVRGGSVAAVVYRDRVAYAVVGDTGPRGIIGEASYATAEALGIRPDPRGGGAPSGVTYIVFKNSRATPIESHASAVAVGERLARQFARVADADPGGPAPPPVRDGEDEADGTADVRPPAWEEDWGPSDAAEGGEGE